MSYPPFPWRLRPSGAAWASVHLVDVAVARQYIPSEFPIVRVWPGKTLGGLFLVHYGPGSVLEYRELVACAATVWHGGRICAWVTHVYVDSAASCRGGREGLGVPKVLARFQSPTGEAGTSVVTRDRRPLCTLRFRRTAGLWRQRIRFCATHLHSEAAGRSTVSIHGNELAGRLLLGRADVVLTPDSPLAVLGLGRPLLAVGAEDAEALFGGAPFLPFHTLPARGA